MCSHPIWAIHTPSPRGQGTQGRATGHQRQRSPAAQEPPRQAAYPSPSRHQQGLPSNVCSAKPGIEDQAASLPDTGRGRQVSSGARDASFDNAGRRAYQGDVLLLPLPYVRCLLSRSRMCLGRHCRGHPVHVSQVGGCPHMCPWVRPHAPSFGRQLWGLPSRVEYLSPQGVLLPLVYGTTASHLWLELRGHSAWQETPSWTEYWPACHRLLPWLGVTFAMVPDAAWPDTGTAPVSRG